MSFRIIPTLALGASLLVLSQGVAAVSHEEAIAWIAAPSPAVMPDAGRVLRAADFPVIASLQPPGYAEEFNFPEMEMEIQATADIQPHQSYVDATREFAGQATIDANGALKNYTAGQPFSKEQIKAASPDQGGLMLAWNRIQRWQYFGWRNDELTMNYIKPTQPGSKGRLTPGLEGGGDVQRFVKQNYHRVYLNHLAWMKDNGYRADAADVETRLYKDYVEFLEPFDVKGTKFVVEHPLDATEEDQVNSYLPSQRRVRRLSAQERADTYMGTDMTMDDFEAFSGRVLDFNWKYLGEKDVLFVVDARAGTPTYFGPQSRVPRDRWQVRRCYAVEVRPTWEKHPYSSKIIFFDQQTMGAPVALAFNRNDELWRIFAVVYHLQQDKGSTPEDQLARSVPLWTGTIAIDKLANTSTISVANKVTVTPSMSARDIKRRFDVSSLGEGR